MIGEAKVNIAGFSFEKIDGKRIIKSIYLSDMKMVAIQKYMFLAILIQIKKSWLKSY